MINLSLILVHLQNFYVTNKLVSTLALLRKLLDSEKRTFLSNPMTESASKKVSYERGNFI